MSKLDDLIKGALLGEVEVGTHELATLELIALRDSHKKLETELAYQEETVLPKLRAIIDTKETELTLIFKQAEELRIDLNDAISQQRKYLRLNVEFHNHNVQLRAELANIKEKAANLLEKMNRTYESTEYTTAFTLYSTHMGDYKKNGGMQWTDEQDALAALISDTSR